MIHKTTLQSIISKYFLNGENNQVKWRIENKQLVIYTGTTGQTSKVVAKNFDFEDAQLGVFDTVKLNKLISITSGELILKTDKIKETHTRMYISDSSFDLTYALADILIFPSVPQYDELDSYEATLNLNREDILNLVKAKNALLDVDNMLVNTGLDLDGNPQVQFIFGDDTGFANKITYNIKGEVNENGISLPFKSNVFRDILKSNSDMDTATLKISGMGLMKLEFTSDTMNSEYVLIRID